MKYLITYHSYGYWNQPTCEYIDEVIEFQFRINHAPSSSISGWYYITRDGINDVLSGGERKSEYVGGGGIWVLSDFPNIQHNGYILWCNSITEFVDVVLLPRFALLCRASIIQTLTSILTVEVL